MKRKARIARAKNIVYRDLFPGIRRLGSGQGVLAAFLNPEAVASCAIEGANMSISEIVARVFKMEEVTDEEWLRLAKVIEDAQ